MTPEEAMERYRSACESGDAIEQTKAFHDLFEAGMRAAVPTTDHHVMVHGQQFTLHPDGTHTEGWPEDWPDAEEAMSVAVVPKCRLSRPHRRRWSARQRVGCRDHPGARALVLSRDFQRRPRSDGEGVLEAGKGGTVNLRANLREPTSPARPDSSRRCVRR